AEDGIRDRNVTGVQTCALPILSSDMDVLRPSLIPGLLDALRHNLHHKTGDVALFEIGRVFQRAAGVSPAGAGRQAAAGALKEKRSEERRVGKGGRWRGGRAEGE